jgi:hypothetical protein
MLLSIYKIMDLIESNGPLISWGLKKQRLKHIIYLIAGIEILTSNKIRYILNKFLAIKKLEFC